MQNTLFAKTSISGFWVQKTFGIAWETWIHWTWIYWFEVGVFSVSFSFKQLFCVVETTFAKDVCIEALVAKFDQLWLKSSIKAEFKISLPTQHKESWASQPPSLRMRNQNCFDNNSCCFGEKRLKWLRWIAVYFTSKQFDEDFSPGIEQIKRRHWCLQLSPLRRFHNNAQKFMDKSVSASLINITSLVWYLPGDFFSFRHVVEKWQMQSSALTPITE